MYRFLMVDDEEIVRRGFTDKIDWKSLGFEFLEPCRDGREAIEAIDSLHPDVVMTDIYMPHVDGLAVAAYAAENCPDTLVVILSGYDEFEYAQKAIRTKVFDYVLKPVTSRELGNLVVKLKAKLDADRRSREDETMLKERADRGESLLKVRSLLDIVSGTPGISEEKFRDLFGFSPKGLACVAVVAERPPSIPEGQAGEGAGAADGLLPQPLAQAAGSARRALVFRPREDREAVLVFEADAQSCDRQAEIVGVKAVAASGPETTVGIGRAYESWVDASRTYDEATAALACRLVTEAGKAFRYTQAREDDPACIAELRSRSEKLCRSLLSGDAAETGAQADAFFRAMRGAGLSPQRIRHEIDDLFATILDDFGGLGVSSATVARELGIDYYRTVERLRTAEEVQAVLSRLSVFAATALASRNLPLPQWKVLDFKEYLARHYAEEDLHIQKVADSLSISASYLSKLVKRHLNKSFVDYLTEFRLARARELLATTDLMTYEIAEACGYPDARYFSSLFKKHAGITPSEFRNQNRGKLDDR